MEMNKRIKLGRGHTGISFTPIMEIVGRGDDAYVWIGNSEKTDGHCFGTILLKDLKKFLE
jgi:hypothetical protein